MMLITATPATAPVTRKMIRMTARGNVLKTFHAAILPMANGVTAIAGIYVGQSGVVITPKNAITRIASGLSDPPHRSGSQETNVVTATTGATVSITKMEKTTRISSIRYIAEQRSHDFFITPLGCEFAA
jgi:hypothetical protein